MFSVAALIATAATAAIPGRSLNVCNADTCAHLCACVCVFDPVRCKLIKVGVRECIESLNLCSCGGMCCCFLIKVSAAGCVAGHEITSLPGWEGALPTKMNSGYIPVVS